MLACPVDGLLGQIIEVARRGSETGLLVVIAFHGWAFELPNEFNAFVRIGVVTDEIAQANVVRAFVFLRVLHHRLDRFEVGVQIAENRNAHLALASAPTPECAERAEC